MWSWLGTMQKWQCKSAEKGDLWNASSGTWFEGRNLIVPIHQQLWYDVKLGCRCGWLWSRESRKESMQKLHMWPCRTWGKDPTYSCSTQQPTICMWKCEFPDFFTVLVHESFGERYSLKPTWAWKLSAIMTKTAVDNKCRSCIMGKNNYILCSLNTSFPQ